MAEPHERARTKDAAVTVDDALAKLTAGLAKDEAKAQASMGIDTPDAEGDPGTWWTDMRTVGGEVHAGGIRRENGFGGKGVFGSTLVARDMAKEDAVHIARQDPRSTLRRVEKVRGIITAYRLASLAAEHGDPDPGYVLAWGEAVQMLAGIYTDQEG